MDDKAKLEKVLQILINAAEFGDDLDPQDLWKAIDEDPRHILSKDALETMFPTTSTVGLM